MGTYNMINVFNACITIGIVVIIFEFISSFTKAGNDIFNSFIKLIFYALLALAIYALALKAQYKTNNPNDYLSLLTFALALFEAIQNLLFLIREFRIKSKLISKNLNIDNPNFEELDLQDIKTLLKYYHGEIKFLNERIRQLEYKSKER